MTNPNSNPISHYRSVPKQLGPQTFWTWSVAPNVVPLALVVFAWILLSALFIRTASVRCVRSSAEITCTTTEQSMLRTSSSSAHISLDRAARVHVLWLNQLFSDPNAWLYSLNAGEAGVPSVGALYFDGRTFRDHIDAPARHGAWRRDDGLAAVRAVFIDGTSAQFAIYQDVQVGRGFSSALVHHGVGIVQLLLGGLMVIWTLKRSRLIQAVVDAERRIVRVRHWPSKLVIESSISPSTADIAVTDRPNNQVVLVAVGPGGQQQAMSQPLSKRHDLHTLLVLSAKISTALEQAQIPAQRPTVREALTVALFAFAAIASPTAVVVSIIHGQYAPHDGTIELRAQHEQCTVNGMTLLPGGVTQWSNSVGLHELSATTRTGQTTAVSYDIEPRRTTVITCDDIVLAASRSGNGLGQLRVTPSTGTFIVPPGGPFRRSDSSE